MQFFLIFGAKKIAALHDEGDIDADRKTVSDDFYDQLASVYGIEPETKSEEV
ncbi:TPA: hypothetical protein ACJ2O6_004906 [Klebsiella pneumoniae]